MRCVLCILMFLPSWVPCTGSRSDSYEPNCSFTNCPNCPALSSWTGHSVLRLPPTFTNLLTTTVSQPAVDTLWQLCTSFRLNLQTNSFVSSLPLYVLLQALHLAFLSEASRMPPWLPQGSREKRGERSLFYLLPALLSPESRGHLFLGFTLSFRPEVGGPAPLRS